MSQPFCVDQLNPAGFKLFNVPYKENSRFFSTRETGNLKINMAEADLSPTTFTSSSASDSSPVTRIFNGGGGGGGVRT